MVTAPWSEQNWRPGFGVSFWRGACRISGASSGAGTSDRRLGMGGTRGCPGAPVSLPSRFVTKISPGFMVIRF